jgi:hypothetical protein
MSATLLDRTADLAWLDYMICFQLTRDLLIPPPPSEDEVTPHGDTEARDHWIMADEGHA